MKKMIFTLALCLGTIVSALAVEPVGSGTIPCVYTASVRFYNVVNGVNVYYGPYYYFNSIQDAYTYVLQVGNASVTCYTEPSGPINS